MPFRTPNCSPDRIDNRSRTRQPKCQSDVRLSFQLREFHLDSTLTDVPGHASRSEAICKASYLSPDRNTHVLPSILQYPSDGRAGAVSFGLLSEVEKVECTRIEP